MVRHLITPPIFFWMNLKGHIETRQGIERFFIHLRGGVDFLDFLLYARLEGTDHFLLHAEDDIDGDGAKEQGATQGPNNSISNGQPLDGTGEDGDSVPQIVPAAGHTRRSPLPRA